jgi:4-hydroxybutyryl-CoA dehydratase / vinylacetyl-CoA-Delta-isomerase
MHCILLRFELDKKYGTPYHNRFLDFLKRMHEGNFVIGGAMTDPKGDRSKAPSEQADPDLYTRVVERNEKGIYISGAKAHQTGCINSHWLIVMPTIRLTEADKDWAIVAAMPADTEGITYIYGRQSCDTRSMEGGDIDVGNAKFGGQEAMIIFDKVFVPWEYVFMHGEYEFASMLVERFTCYHRRSYVCKTGLGDALIGAAATIADYNGVEKVSHIKDKLVEMTHLNETIYGLGIASSSQGKKMESGVYQPDDMLAQVCKHNVTRFPYEISRLAQDIAGGLVVTMPSEKDFRHPETGPLLKKYLAGKEGVEPENRMRILRLIENLTLGRNAVGYLTESMHGAGSPQAQRIQIQRLMQTGYKKNIAKNLAGIKEEDVKKSTEENDSYFKSVFDTDKP